jgi:aminoglycoside phosphotransferase (APT) family kinase protein
MSQLPLDQPSDVRSGEELDITALDAFLRERGLAGEAAPEVRQFPGGYSNLTYLVRAGGRELVLRRPPFGANIRGGHDMGREFRILRALEGHYPRAPRALAFCDDEAALGAPFYLMERVTGVILRAAPPPDDSGPGASSMRRVGEAAIDTLAELHALDYRAAGLGELGRPEGYTARQVAGWTKRYGAARTDDCPDLAPLAAWLAANTPATGDAALIHNDFKHDNLVLDPADLARVVAVLDWEMATVGDPLTDLGTTLAYWAEPGDPEALRRAGPASWPGSPSRQQVIERYAAASGRDVSGIVFFYAYGLFKNAVIAQQIYARYRQGHTRDERFARMVDVVGLYGATAERALALGRVSRLW